MIETRKARGGRIRSRTRKTRGGRIRTRTRRTRGGAAKLSSAEKVRRAEERKLKNRMKVLPKKIETSQGKIARINKQIESKKSKMGKYNESITKIRSDITILEEKKRLESLNLSKLLEEKVKFMPAEQPLLPREFPSVPTSPPIPKSL